MRFIAIPCIAAALVLSACASAPSSRSYVDSTITINDAKALAFDAAAFLSQPLPPAQTTLLLEAPVLSGNASDLLTPAMQEALRSLGYGVSILAPKLEAAPIVSGTLLGYIASPLDSGVILRLEFEGKQASRYYQRSKDGVLQSGFPFTVGGANEQQR